MFYIVITILGLVLTISSSYLESLSSLDPLTSPSKPPIQMTFTTYYTFAKLFVLFFNVKFDEGGDIR